MQDFAIVTCMMNGMRGACTTLLLLLAGAWSTQFGMVSWTASDPQYVVGFLETYLGVSVSASDCLDGLCLCGLEYEGHLDGMDFVLRVAYSNTSARPDGVISLQEFEEILTEKFAEFERFDAFMDNNLGFWTSDLDTYTTAFDDGNVDYLVTKWSFDESQFYSLIVGIPGSQVVLEIMSDSAPDFEQVELVQSEPRYFFATSLSELQSLMEIHSTIPVRISRATSDLDSLLQFYVDVFNVSDISMFTFSNGTRVASIFSPTESEELKKLELHFVERSASATSPSLTVKDWESNLYSLHRDSLVSTVCGYDVWMDTYFEIEVVDSALDEYYEKLLVLDTPMHLWWNDLDSANASIFFIDPTGYPVELMGALESGPLGISVFDEQLCSIGNCE